MSSVRLLYTGLLYFTAYTSTSNHATLHEQVHLQRADGCTGNECLGNIELKVQHNLHDVNAKKRQDFPEGDTTLDSTTSGLQLLESMTAGLQPLESMTAGLQPLESMTAGLQPLESINTELQPLESINTELQPLESINTELQPSESTTSGFQPSEIITSGLQPFSTTLTYSYPSYMPVTATDTTTFDSSLITTSTVITVYAVDQFHAYQSFLTAGQSVIDDASSSAGQATQMPVSVSASTTDDPSTITLTSSSTMAAIATTTMPISAAIASQTSQAAAQISDTCWRQNGLVLALAALFANMH